MAHVTVHVLDRNEWAPALRQRLYRGRVSEAARPGALVAAAGQEPGAPLVLQTDDADGPAHRQRAYEILQPAAAALFRVDATTGALHLLAPLDYERAARHEFTVRVRASRRPRSHAATALHLVLIPRFHRRSSTWVRRDYRRGVSPM